METETIASRNVVELLLNEEFNCGLCNPKIAASQERFISVAEYYLSSGSPEDNFVLGWDC